MRVKDPVVGATVIEAIGVPQFAEEALKQETYWMDYVVYENRDRIRVHCRRCNEVIADIVDTHEYRDRASQKIYVRQTFKPLSNYTKVKLLLTDGSRIDSAMCKRCISGVDLRSLYISEVYAVMYDGVMRDLVGDTRPTAARLAMLGVDRRID